MTLGVKGGALKPLSRDELLALARRHPVFNLAQTGQAFRVTEPVIREMHRRGELEQMGIRVLRLGAQYRIPASDILRVLGLDSDSTGEGGPDAA
jgi:hypothetical protein